MSEPSFSFSACFSFFLLQQGLGNLAAPLLSRAKWLQIMWSLYASKLLYVKLPSSPSPMLPMPSATASSCILLQSLQVTTSPSCTSR